MITFGVVHTKEKALELSYASIGFFNEMGYDLNIDDLMEEIERASEQGVVVYAKHYDLYIGLIIGLKITQFLLKQEWLHERCFFVHPEYRMKKVADKLQDIFCEWARINGCKSVIIAPCVFGSSEPKLVADFLKRKGYSLHGYSMRKEL